MTTLGTQRLVEAIKAGDRSAVGRLLDEEPAVAEVEVDGVSPVLLAVYHGHRGIAALIAARKGALTVFEAAATGDVRRVREIIDRDPAAATAYAPDGFFPLGLAAFFDQPGVVALLIERGADVNAVARNPMAVTALHSAVANGGDGSIARTLIGAGADVNVRQRHGWTPLHGAADAGDAGLVKLLLARGADASARNDAGKSALDLARERGHEQVAELLRKAAPAQA